MSVRVNIAIKYVRNVLYAARQGVHLKAKMRIYMKNKLIVTVVMICMAVCILAMALYIILGNNNAVCKVTFDSDGGTEVAEINVMAGPSFKPPHSRKTGFFFFRGHLCGELLFFFSSGAKNNSF